MAVLMTAAACFVCGFAVAWVVLWSAWMSALNRQAERNHDHVSALNAQLRNLSENQRNPGDDDEPELVGRAGPAR